LKIGSTRLGPIFDLDKKRKKIKDLEDKMAQPQFWENHKKARQISKKHSDLKEIISKWEEINDLIKDALVVAKQDKKDKKVNLRKDLEKLFYQIKEKLEDLEIQEFLKGKYDKRNAYISIHAGVGGKDAEDWVKMLLRMYKRFADKKDWESEIIERSKGSENGLKSVTIFIKGDFAFGFLKSETGVHRLVRISPFDSEKMRHTSFALIEVLPEMDDVEVNVNMDDVRVDTFLSSGPGGQHMQKNESAVRLIHLPTGIVASCESARSQNKNKEKALKILKTKLYQYLNAEKQEEKDRILGKYKPAVWGNQTRSYVLDPYKLVKDHKSNFETQKVEEVLEGDLFDIIDSSLKTKN